MSDTPGTVDAERDRRRNAALRVLIDEMLAGLRELNRNAGEWDPEERARAERELEAIMTRVREEAARRGDGR